MKIPTQNGEQLSHKRKDGISKHDILYYTNECIFRCIYATFTVVYLMLDLMYCYYDHRGHL